MMIGSISTSQYLLDISGYFNITENRILIRVSTVLRGFGGPGIKSNVKFGVKNRFSNSLISIELAT